MFLLATGFVVDTRLRFTNNQVVEPRVQHPTSSAGSERSLHNTDNIYECQQLIFTNAWSNVSEDIAAVTSSIKATNPMSLWLQQGGLHAGLYAVAKISGIAVSGGVFVPALEIDGRWGHVRTAVSAGGCSRHT